jgi:hypothetical protein
LNWPKTREGLAELIPERLASHSARKWKALKTKEALKPLLQTSMMA